MKRKTPRIAVVHDWLTVYAGAERVLEQILNVWPEADLFSVIDYVPEAERSFLHGKRATTTFLQRFPWVKKKYRNYLPFMPLAIEQLDLSGYDIIISSSHAVAKGVLTGSHQLHISYVYSPMRYAWDCQHQYLVEVGLIKGLKSLIVRLVLHYMRIWDSRTVNSVDYYIAVSKFIARRIRKIYRRRAIVINPPVDIGEFSLYFDKEDFYITASRMVPYKRIPLIAEAFSLMPEKTLIIIGDGPEFDKVNKFSSQNVHVLGHQPADILIKYMQRAKAFIFAAEEDFGIVPIEAQACGTPVIAFGKGGALETVIENETGIFFHEQTVTSIHDAINQFEALPNLLDPDSCRRNAERFSSDIFRGKIKQAVMDAWMRF